MKQIEVHCIPKYKRKLMNLLDEEEKKQEDEENKYKVHAIDQAKPGQIMHALNFLSFMMPAKK